MLNSVDEKRYVEIDGVKYYKYHTLLVTEEGKVYKEKELSEGPIEPKDRAIYFKEVNPPKNKDGKRKRKGYQVKRIVYEAITGTTVNAKYRIECIDGNEDNCAFSNLKLVKVKDLVDAEKCNKHYLISEAQRQKIRENKYELTISQLADLYSTTPATIMKIKSGNHGKDWYKIKNSDEELREEKKTS